MSNYLSFVLIFLLIFRSFSRTHQMMFHKITKNEIFLFLNKTYGCHVENDTYKGVSIINIM